MHMPAYFSKVTLSILHSKALSGFPSHPQKKPKPLQRRTTSMFWCPVPSVPPLLLLSPLLTIFQHKSILDVPWVFQACFHRRNFVLLSSFLCLNCSPAQISMAHSFRPNVIFGVRPNLTTLWKTATPTS